MKPLSLKIKALEVFLPQQETWNQISNSVLSRTYNTPLSIFSALREKELSSRRVNRGDWLHFILKPI